jgi:hypothetical protein
MGTQPRSLTIAFYRGIALQSVLYKIAAAFTDKQVLAACDSLGLMCNEQKAARKHGGEGDHVATMTAAMADAMRYSRELRIVTRDIQKAFDELPRAALAEALTRHGFPQEVVRRASSMLQTCAGSTVTVRTHYCMAVQTKP